MQIETKRNAHRDLGMKWHFKRPRTIANIVCFYFPLDESNQVELYIVISAICMKAHSETK